MSSPVCIDASLALKLVLAEEDSPKAQHLWDTWVDTGVEIVAPFLLVFEGTSVIHNKIYRGLVPSEEGELMFRVFHLLGVKLLHPDGLHQGAWELAKRFNRPQAYDSYYLALAEIFGLEFWTGDERLYNAFQEKLSWIKWLGDYQPV